MDGKRREKRRRRERCRREDGSVQTQRFFPLSFLYKLEGNRSVILGCCQKKRPNWECTVPYNLCNGLVEFYRYRIWSTTVVNEKNNPDVAHVAHMCAL